MKTRRGGIPCCSSSRCFFQMERSRNINNGWKISKCWRATNPAPAAHQDSRKSIKRRLRNLLVVKKSIKKAVSCLRSPRRSRRTKKRRHGLSTHCCGLWQVIETRKKVDTEARAPAPEMKTPKKVDTEARAPVEGVDKRLKHEKKSIQKAAGLCQR